MARIVLIAATLAGCYSPQLADCVDTCGTSRICPEGLSCSDGFCRVEGATGACEVPVDAAPDTPADAAVDAPPMVTDMAMGCPPVPMAQGCTNVGPMPVMPYCFVACAAAAGTTALAFDVGTWHAAVIQDAAELGVATNILPGQMLWIGLSQPAGQAAPATGWTWPTGVPVTYSAWSGPQPDDGDDVENGAEQCGVLIGSAWFDEPCTASHIYLIEPF